MGEAVKLATGDKEMTGVGIAGPGAAATTDTGTGRISGDETGGVVKTIGIAIDIGVGTGAGSRRGTPGGRIEAHITAAGPEVRGWTGVGRGMHGAPVETGTLDKVVVC